MITRRRDGWPGQREVRGQTVDERDEVANCRQNQLVGHPDSCGYPALLGEVSVGVLFGQCEAGVGGGGQERVDFTGVYPGKLVRVAHSEPGVHAAYPTHRGVRLSRGTETHRSDVLGRPLQPGPRFFPEAGA